MTDDPVIAHSPRLVLASSSPRRRQLLSEAGYRFEVISPAADAEDGRLDAESAEQMVMRLARQKAADVARQLPTGIIIGCDTVALCKENVLGKPAHLQDARRMLQLMSGQKHRVLSGLCLWQRPSDRVICRSATTFLAMEKLEHRQLEEYLATDQWKGKAGGFGYQDNLDWIRIVEGSESNVVGLPLELLAELLDSLPPD
ncbi:MAG: nucleoside triphosphate pyrophosphatase [Pirellulaceae bacterium]|jgi:septum formation protein|nr:nucleoside triphosphate pyrophosphatase [Pirellulaceae bacterium]